MQKILMKPCCKYLPDDQLKRILNFMTEAEKQQIQQQKQKKTENYF